MSRLEPRFGELAAAGRGGLVTFLMAGDPDPETFARLLAELPAAGADVIEIGMPFSDPMADGPSIQAAGQRALKSGMTLPRTLEAVRAFRAGDDATPVVLMGYYNPIYSYGVDRFVPDARAAGVDGLIVVDLPPEEDRELCDPVTAGGLDWVRLVAPTTGEERMGRMLARATGFVYYVSIAGITGTRSAAAGTVETAVERLRRHTRLPVAVGFGIRTAAQAADVARVADAAVVGTALVDVLRETLDERDRAGPESVSRVRDYVAGLAAAVRGARG